MCFFITRTIVIFMLARFLACSFCQSMGCYVLWPLNKVATSHDRFKRVVVRWPFNR